MAGIALVFVLYCFYTVLQPTLWELGDRLCARLFNRRQAGTGLEDIEPEPAPAAEINWNLPAGILAYARSWGQDWVEASVIERAKALYLQEQNWDVVYQRLLEQDGETK